MKRFNRTTARTTRVELIELDLDGTEALIVHQEAQRIREMMDRPKSEEEKQEIEEFFEFLEKLFKPEIDLSFKRVVDDLNENLENLKRGTKTPNNE